MQSLTQVIMKQALNRLDEILPEKVELFIGGGGAMLLAYNFPLATADIDAIPKGMSISDFDIYVKQVAKDLSLPADWLNPYFSTFAHTLPQDFPSRLILVFKGNRITAHALGPEDLLIMKCFAHRQKDIPHARALIKAGAKTDFVGKHIETLQAKKIPHADLALEFLDELLDE